MSDHHMSGDPVHPIEALSYQIMAGRVDLSAWEPPERDVVARMVHATADDSFATSARVGVRAVAAAVAALNAGAAVVCDSEMVVAGVPRVVAARCWLDQVPVAPPGTTRSAAAIRLAGEQHPKGAIWVVGNAPTALSALLDLHDGGLVEPAAVIGLPVGYVGAAAAKARLLAGPLAPVTIANVGERGGSAVAAAALNALRRLA